MTPPHSDSSEPSAGETFALVEAERLFLATLVELGVPFLIVGVGSAALQGARLITEDIDLWFQDRTDRRISLAAQRSGGVFVPGHFGMMPPQVGGGPLGDRFDVVLAPDGLGDFAAEYAGSREVLLDGLAVRILPLERVIASKRAANRPKDLAALPALEAALAVQKEAEGGDV